MRFFYLSLLALLPLIGFPLSVSACACNHAESAEHGINAVSCCHEMPADCCVQKERQTQPKTPLYVVITSPDTFSVTLVAVATITDQATIARPQTTVTVQKARAPPLQAKEHRCQLQSWLI